MNYKHSFLGLVATAGLLVAPGCSKQEPSTTPAVDKTSSVRPNTEKTDTAPKVPAVETAATPKAEPVAAAKSAPTPVTPTAPSTPAAPAATEPAKAPAVAESKAPSILQSSFQAQKLALTQAATNQVLAALGATDQPSGTITNPLPGLATSATTQWQALATAATNRALAALGITNVATTTATNQVEALLEKAKNLSTNQKYQEALATVTQLYNTKLTPEQKLKADELKAQIQAQLTQKATSEATSVLGGLLGGKK